MRGAFLATKRPYAQDAFDGAARALDAYTSAWVAMHTEACEATRVRGEQSAELLDLRMECLSRRLDETRALTEVLSRGDAKVVENAVTAVKSLGELTACADASALNQPAKLPSDPALRARIADLYKQVASGKALDEAGRYAEGLPIAKAVTAAAKGLYKPLEAEAWNLLGDLATDTDDYKTAESAFREATLAGEAGRDDDATAHGYVQLFEVVGYRLDRFEEAHEIQGYAQVAVQRAGDERHRARLLDILAGELAEEGRYDDALAKGEEALKMKERLFGPDDLETAKTGRRIGVILYEQGRYREALEAHRRVLASDERVLGAGHPVVATALEDVGDDLRELGRYDEALIAHRRALEVRERAFGSVNARAAHSLFEIGVTLVSQGNLKEALGYYQRAQETQEKSRTPEEEICDTIRFEAEAHAELGEYAEAERLFPRIMSTWTRVYGPDHPYVAWVLDAQGNVRAGQGRYDEALTLGRRALAIQETAKVTSSPEYADTLASIGAALRGQGRLSEALGFDRRALAVREKAVGAQNANVARDRSAIGDDLRLLGQLEEARGEHQRAIAILEQVMGPGHPRLAAPLTGLGEDELELRGFDRAAAALERALALRLASPGKPIDLAETRFALARALRSLGRDPERARKLAVEARATWLHAGALGRRELATVDAWLKS
jgi:tetratricopeptide (TPR) repeat protein